MTHSDPETSEESDSDESSSEYFENSEDEIGECSEVFDSSSATFKEKLLALVSLLKVDRELFRNRFVMDRLSNRIPIEIFETIFDPAHEQFVNYRPALIQVLCLLGRYASAMVYKKFKPLMWNAVAALDPNDNRVKLDMNVYSNMTAIVGRWADEAGDGKCLYELLRHITIFYAKHHADLDVWQYLLHIRTLLYPVSEIAPLEPKEAYDNRIWDVEILSVVRRLLQSEANQDNQPRQMIWQVIGTMAEIGGTAWLKLDKTFCKTVIQMNEAKIKATLQTVRRIDYYLFLLHFKILKQYTNAIVEEEMFDEEGEEDIVKAVADTIRFILSYWVNAFLEQHILPLPMYGFILELVIPTFRHKHFLLQEERVEKHFGAAMLDTAFRLFENSREFELKEEFLEGPLTDTIKKLNEIEILNETVPVFVLKYLDKMRLVLDYKTWKQRVFECRECLIELRCRIDWYSVESIQEAKDLLPRFTEPEQHELSHIFRVLYDLPPFVQ